MSLIPENATGSLPWPTDRYLNIWVRNLQGLLGYATSPADYRRYPQSDGVVIRTTAFGRIGNLEPLYNRGRTTTHEIGHWLALYHLKNGIAVCADDFVNDTPKEQAIHSGSTCPSYPDLAGRCDQTDPSTMFMNFMEWVPDACQNLFTNGQRQRTRAIFATVNGVLGERAAQLNNYFRFINPPAFICNGTITVGPMCLPTNWTVTGPVTIVSGQGTNQIRLQATGNGTANITVTSGNYTNQMTVSVGTGTPPSQYTLYASYTSGGTTNWLQDVNCLKTYTFPGMYSGNIDLTDQVATSFNWTFVSKYPSTATLGIGPTSDPQHVTVTVKPQGASVTYRLTTSNACGSYSHDYTFVADGPCDIAMASVSSELSVAPNPVAGSFAVSLNTDSKKAFIKEVIVQNRYGTQMKRIKFSNDRKSQTVDIQNLPTDIYIVQVFDGEKWLSEKIVKQ